MRHLNLYLLGSAVFVAACQPVTLTTVKTTTNPEIIIASNSQTKIDLVFNTATKTANSGADSGASFVTGTDSGTDAVLGNNNSTEETAIAAIPAAPPVQSTPVQSPFHPKTMIGSASIILIHNLGIANMIRQEGPIEIWQYRFDECVVDFFFYPASQGSSQLIIKDWDMRSAIIGGRVNEGKCLATMDQQHQKLAARS